jgi:hypothetical protein
MTAAPRQPEEIVERVRRSIYRRFADTGMAATRADTAADVEVGADAVSDAYAELARQRHIVLGPDGEIVLAHPFAAINLHFSVMGERTLYWGGCAWDSFAIPHLVPAEPAVLVATTCPGCGSPHAWTVTAQLPPTGDQLAHFLVPAARIWDDVVFTCGHQRIFCGESCIADWLARTGHTRGSVFDLATLWRLAQHWYDGRLESPYRRREPAQAHAYFAEVGLTGSFWGLPD